MNKYAKDYVRRWRVLAMLSYIKSHLHDNNVDIGAVIDSYIDFISDIDEDEWEKQQRKKDRQNV